MRLCTLIFFLLVFNAAECCTCPSLPKINDEQYNSYDFIATGTVTRVLDDKWQRFIYLKVDTLYKGGEGNDTIQIVSSNREASCGISPKTGEQWLVFAFAKGSELHTTLCTRTKSMNPQTWNYNKSAIDDDIVFLKNKLHSSFSLVFPASLLAIGAIGVLWSVRKRRSR